MLDVHPPEHGLHGVRDFSIHLLTITVGLLIALGLEDAVAAMHHRHQRKEAEASIRQELRDSRADILQAKPMVLEEYKSMHTLLIYVQARSQGKDAELHGVSLRFSEAPMQDSAWRTAASTGVLSYMDYAEVQRLSTAYKQQEMLQASAEAALGDYFEIGTILGDVSKIGTISQADATTAMPSVRHALAHLAGMINIGMGTLETYDDALK